VSNIYFDVIFEYFGDYRSVAIDGSINVLHEMNRQILVKMNYQWNLIKGTPSGAEKVSP